MQGQARTSKGKEAKSLGLGQKRKAQKASIKSKFSQGSLKIQVSGKPLELPSRKSTAPSQKPTLKKHV